LKPAADDLVIPSGYPDMGSRRVGGTAPSSNFHHQDG